MTYLSPLFGDDASDTAAAAASITARQRQMDAIKQMPVNVALVLLQGGQSAINQARQIGTLSNLPGSTARDNVYWKLQWHANTLAGLVGTPFAIYTSADDLKRWVMQGFIELDTAQYGQAYSAQLWSQMWDQIGKALAALPVEIAQKVGQAASGLFGIPIWLLALGGVAVAVVGYRVVKAVV